MFFPKGSTSMGQHGALSNGQRKLQDVIRHACGYRGLRSGAARAEGARDAHTWECRPERERATSCGKFERRSVHLAWDTL
jgi:hypothetical protein